MSDNQLIEQTQCYLRMALPMMSRHRVPITPRNYDVWYQYVSGCNHELSGAIDAFRNKGEAFTEEVNENLYRKYCAEISEGAAQRLREDLKNMLTNVVEEFAAMTGKAEKYNSVLTGSIAKLSDDLSAETIKVVLDDILDETKKISGHGLEMQRRLQQTTAELENIQKEFERAKMEASVDFLTGAANRKTFNENLERLAGEAVRTSEPLSLLLLDIDHFKKFNDEHGHLVGDEVLKFVAKIIKEHVRGQDLIARYGGEEFVVLLPSTPLGGAKILAEKIRRFFDHATLKTMDQSKTLGRITLCIGVAGYRPEEKLSDFVGRADKALYLAKNNGRNKVVAEVDIQ
ncbi:MAG: GGDEF domain-containing protein [Desulfobacteraceae bacterium]|nr:GGDEF domain-containing protein [Desulfobacteraceae bacterium]